MLLHGEPHMFFFLTLLILRFAYFLIFFFGGGGRRGRNEDIIKWKQNHLTEYFKDLITAQGSMMDTGRLSMHPVLPGMSSCVTRTTLLWSVNARISLFAVAFLGLAWFVPLSICFLLNSICLWPPPNNYRSNEDGKVIILYPWRTQCSARHLNFIRLKYIEGLLWAKAYARDWRCDGEWYRETYISGNTD